MGKRSASGDSSIPRRTAAIPPRPVASGLTCATSGSPPMSGPMRAVSCQPMAALGAMLSGRRRGPASPWPPALVAGGAIGIGIVVGVALALPQYQLVFAGIALSPVILALLGAEMCIGILLLAAVGCVPFVNAEDVAGGLPIWLVAASVAVGLMLLTLITRVIARAPAWPVQPSVLGLAILVMLAYVLERLSASSPFDIPSLTANIAAFAVMAPITWFWFAHVAAVEGLRRALPVMAILISVWCLLWIAGSVGACSQCQVLVGSTQQAGGVAGTLRLYASGESAAGVMVLFALAWLVWRPSLWAVALIVLGTTVVILGGS